MSGFQGTRDLLVDTSPDWEPGVQDEDVKISHVVLASSGLLVFGMKLIFFSFFFLVGSLKKKVFI